MEGGGEVEEVLRKGCVCVVVLGDIGRSPRMRYHAESLAKEGFLVHIIGYDGSPLPPSVANHPAIWVNHIPPPPATIQNLPRVVGYPLKVVWQAVFLVGALVWMLLRHQFYPHSILLQNPPAIPTLPVVYLFSKLLFADMVVDWHNYAYSLMAIGLKGEGHPIVKFSKRLEDTFGAKADKHLCVTKAMKEDLEQRLGIKAVTLYDRPPTIFRPFEEGERKEFLEKMSTEYPCLKELTGNSSGRNRPGLLVSSTSWTEDEDFSILLDALKEYEAGSQDEPQFYPKLIVFITGKGPQKEYYKELIDSLHFKNVQIYLPWLEHSDYPKLLASCDLGVSLHYSSSGLDLPMKVVDMFGCGLPVCAYNFNCLAELVKHEQNGFVFNDSTELAHQIQNWFKISSKPNQQHKQFRENLKKFQALRWHENWKMNALPLFKLG